MNRVIVALGGVPSDEADVVLDGAMQACLVEIDILLACRVLLAGRAHTEGALQGQKFLEVVQPFLINRGGTIDDCETGTSEDCGDV